VIETPGIGPATVALRGFSLFSTSQPADARARASDARAIRRAGFFMFEPVPAYSGADIHPEGGTSSPSKTRFVVVGERAACAGRRREKRG
jgi:hypothetical protein